MYRHWMCETSQTPSVDSRKYKNGDGERETELKIPSVGLLEETDMVGEAGRKELSGRL